MARRFNKSQRQAFFILADGKCQGCGNDLRDDWEADHVEPWSKGGSTTLTNGQALCQKCNRKKGSGMVDYRPWQNNFFDTYLNKKPDDFLLEATPGGGKTWAALGIAQKLLSSEEILQIIIVCPTDALKRQWAKEAARFGIQIDPSWNRTKIKTGFRGISLTYSSTDGNAGFLDYLCQPPKKTLVILDEIHHAGDTRAWGIAVRQAFTKATKRLCLSGTPFRSDDNEIPFVTYRNGESVADFKYTYGDAITDKVCRNINFPAFDGYVSWWNGKDEKLKESETFDEILGEQEEKQRLRVALDPSQPFVKSMFSAAVKKLREIRLENNRRAAGLVVAIDNEHANSLAGLLESLTGKSPVVVHSDIPDPTKLIEEFEQGDDEWIIAVKMVSEGVDIGRLTVGIYATNITTELSFRQIIGRVIRRKSDDDEWAFFYVPKDRRLVEFMEKIKEERNHVINKGYQDILEQLRRSTNNGEMVKAGITPVSAIHNPNGDINVTDGVIYQRNFVEEAMQICGEIGIKANEAQAAMLVKKLQEIHKEKTIPTPTATEQIIPDYQKLKDLRDIVNKRAYGVACQIKEENSTIKTERDIVKFIHAKWSKKPGRHKQGEAGLEELKDKLAWLDTQIREPWEYI